MPAKTAKALVNTQDSWTAEAFFGAFQGTDESPRQKVEGGSGTDILSAPVGPFFDLHLALGEATRPHQDLIGNSNKVCGREFRARPFVEIMIEHLNPFRRKIAVELLAPAVGLGRALLEVKNRDLERRDLSWP